MVAFKDGCSNLLDVALCKCLDADCLSPADQMVPKRVRCFLRDQRNARKMHIGNTDKAVSRKLLKIFKRKQSSKPSQQPNTSIASVELENSDEDIDECDNISDLIFDVSVKTKWKLQRDIPVRSQISDTADNRCNFAFFGCILHFVLTLTSKIGSEMLSHSSISPSLFASSTDANEVFGC